MGDGIRVPSRDPRHVRPVEGELGVEGPPGVPPGRSWRRKRPRDDHLRGGEPAVALREADRDVVPGWCEERMPLVDPVVDHADLHAAAGRLELGPPDSRRADRRRGVVEGRVVAHRRVHADDAGQSGQLCEAVYRQDDGERIEHNPVSPAHACAREPLDARLETALRCVDHRERTGRAFEPGPANAAMRRRGGRELDDHLHRWGWSGGRSRERAGLRRARDDQKRERNEEEEQQQTANDPVMVSGRLPVEVCHPCATSATLRQDHADVAELVDAHGSGPCGGNPVEVRFLSSAFALVQKDTL